MGKPQKQQNKVKYSGPEKRRMARNMLPLWCDQPPQGDFTTDYHQAIPREIKRRRSDFDAKARKVRWKTVWKPEPQMIDRHGNRVKLAGVDLMIQEKNDGHGRLFKDWQKESSLNERELSLLKDSHEEFFRVEQNSSIWEQSLKRFEQHCLRLQLNAESEARRGQERQVAEEKQARAAAEQQKATVAGQLSELRRRMGEAWPVFFLQEPIADWRFRIEEKFSREDDVAIKLFLTLARFGRMIQSSVDAVKVAGRLNQISLAACEFWKKWGMDALRAAQEWRDAFQQYLDCAGIQLEIDLAIEGLPFNTDAMLASDDGTAQRMLVKEVRSWIVRDKSKPLARVLSAAHVLTY